MFCCAVSFMSWRQEGFRVLILKQDLSADFLVNLMTELMKLCAGKEYETTKTIYLVSVVISVEFPI